MEGSFTNVLNHLNLNLPVAAINTSSVGLITSAAAANFGETRTGPVGSSHRALKTAWLQLTRFQHLTLH